MAKNLGLVILSTFLLLSIGLGQEESTTPPTLWRVVNHGEACSPNSLLNPAYCRPYGGTVRCKIVPPVLSGICECNLEEDAVFDVNQQICVALVGGLCFTQPTSLGKKVCTPGADCVAEDWPTGTGGHIVGKCECMTGWENGVNGTCVPRDGETPGTVSPTTTRSPLFPPPQATSPHTAEPRTTTLGSGAASSWQKKTPMIIVSAIFSFTLLFLC